MAAREVRCVYGAIKRNYIARRSQRLLTRQRLSNNRYNENDECRPRVLNETRSIFSRQIFSLGLVHVSLVNCVKLYIMIPTLLFYFCSYLAYEDITLFFKQIYLGTRWPRGLGTEQGSNPTQSFMIAAVSSILPSASVFSSCTQL